MKSQLIIAAPSSNAGKTTVTLGLLRLLRNKGISVQPFKTGPDYIDPKFHHLASGRKSINLDMFMMEEEEIKSLPQKYGANCQVNLVEGVMGLFDGSAKDKGSTAALAIQLNTPVILVIDAKAVAYSVAPLIKGFKDFNPQLALAGVIFNRTGSERHYNMLKEACEDINVRTFGHLPRLEDVEIPSRHLGLNIQDIHQFEPVIEKIAAQMEQTLDFQALVSACRVASYTPAPSTGKVQNKEIRFAVAHDEAFNFVYEQVLQTMEKMGQIHYFSPLSGKALPDADLVYFPGGYPECYLEKLSSNHSMLGSVLAFAERGGRIYAECGGMMYLGKSIIDKQGKAYDMAGLFDFSSSFEKARLHLGYRTMKLGKNTIKGHEFHYSEMVNVKETPAEVEIMDAREKTVESPVFKKGNTLASYIHLYFGNIEKMTQLLNQLQYENIHT